MKMSVSNRTRTEDNKLHLFKQNDILLKTFPFNQQVTRKSTVYHICKKLWMFLEIIKAFIFKIIVTNEKSWSSGPVNSVGTLY